MKLNNQRENLRKQPHRGGEDLLLWGCLLYLIVDDDQIRKYFRTKRTVSTYMSAEMFLPLPRIRFRTV